MRSRMMRRIAFPMLCTRSGSIADRGGNVFIFDRTPLIMIARGAPDEVVRDPAVLECYLGEETQV